jgi:ribosomal protein S18 acetylase RimI-like enzyme
LPELILDALGRDELPALLALCRETGCCGGDADLAWLRHRTLGDPSVALDLMLAARCGDDLAGFAIGCVRGAQGVIKAFAVAGPYRRQGIATRLLDELEARLARRSLPTAYVGGVGPNFFATGVSLRQMPAIALLMRRGYTTDRVARVDMQANLARADWDTEAQQARLASQGIAVRRARSDEVEQVAAFAAEHFADAWRAEVLDAGHYDPPALFVAHEGPRLIAFAAHEALGPAYFGPTGTLSAQRSRGIGGLLLKLCLGDMRVAGHPVARMAWAGPVDYYARVVGAEVTDAFWCFEKPLA